MLTTVQRGYVYRAYPSADVKKYFLQCFGADRKIYNFHVARLYEFMESSNYEVGTRIKKADLKMPSVATIKKMFSGDDGNLYLYEVDAFASNEAKQHFFKALANFNDMAFKKQYRKSALKRVKNGGRPLSFYDLKGLPRFHSKKNNDFSYTTFNQNGNIQLNGTVLTLPIAQKSNLKQVAVELNLHRKMPEASAIKNVTVSMNAKGEFYVSLCVEFVMNIENVGYPSKFLGIDYSQFSFFVEHNGKKANYPLFMRKMEKRLAKEQKKLSRMVKGSKRWNKQRLIVAKLHIKVANQRKDWLHKKAFALANKFDCVVLEDLDLRFLSQNSNYAKKQQDNGFGYFRTYLQYKLEQRGKYFLKAPKDFASTQQCSCCGFKNEALKGIENIGVREWDCPNCKVHHDRDINAGQNLKNYGQRYFQDALVA